VNASRSNADGVKNLAANPDARKKEKGSIKQESFSERFHGTRASPNDRKLSDTPERRGTCMVGGKVAAEAGAVTHGAVRCSAWLGDVGFGSEDTASIDDESDNQSFAASWFRF
jgi:hypothetical protein